MRSCGLGRSKVADVATDLKTQMLERLMDAGDWLTRNALARNLSNSPPAIEDALADLVIESKAEFSAKTGYRLAGGATARRAAQLLRKRGLRRQVVAEPNKSKGGYCIGVAEMRALSAGQALSLVMYEMAVPPIPGPFGPAHQRQLEAMMNFGVEHTPGGHRHG